MYKHLLYIQHKHQEHHEKVNVKHIVITIDITIDIRIFHVIKLSIFHIKLYLYMKQLFVIESCILRNGVQYIALVTV